MKAKAIWMIITAALIISLLGSAVLAELEGTASVSVGLVNQDPDPAVAGDIVELRLSLENVGGRDTNSLQVEIVPSYPFDIPAGEKAVQDAGTLYAYQGYYDSGNAKIIKFKVRVDKDARAGTYELKVRTYEKGSIAKTEKSLPVDVRSRENAEIIHIDKTVLIPGRQSSLRFVINNVGNAPLRDLTFNWENDESIVLPVGSDNTRYVKYVDIGGSEEIEYQVIADTNAAPGLYKLNLYLTYEDSINKSSKKISTIAGVYVGGETDFEVAFSESSAGETAFSVANIGSNPANSVSVIVPDQPGWTTSGSSAVIIGNLNKGDYTVASFSLQQRGGFAGAGNRTGGQRPQSANDSLSAPGKIRIQVAYTDTTGERRSVEKDVNVPAQGITSAASASGAAGQGFQRRAESQGFFSTYAWQIALAAAAGLALFGYFRYKKLRMMNPKAKFTDIFQGQKKK